MNTASKATADLTPPALVADLRVPPHKAPRIPELDGLRGLAILLVVTSHYIGRDNPALTANPVFFWLAYGFSGVDLFFVLSGFLVGGILMDARSSPNYFKTFYIRRVCRIFPLYYLLLFAAIAWSCYAGEFTAEARRQIPWFMAYAQNFLMATGRMGPPFMSVTWSLAIEEQFYLTLPLLILYLNPKRLPIALCSFVVLTVVVRWAIADHYGSYPAYVLTFCRSDALSLGVLAAWLQRNESAWNALVGWRPRLQIVTVLLLGLILWLHSVMHQSVYSYSMVRIGYTLFALLYTSLLLLLLSKSNGKMAAIFRLSPLRSLGWYSYFIYLFHGPVNHVLNYLILDTSPDSSKVSGLGVACLAAASVFGLAVISWKIFESKFIDYGRKWSY